VVPPNPGKLTPEARNHIFYTHLPCLAVLLNHPQALDTTQPPNTVLDVFRYAIILTLPQKKRHIARELLVPFYNRCNRLHRLLVAAIDSILTSQKSYTPEAIREFHTTARELYSRFDGSKRNTARLIMRRGALLTQKSDHGYENGRLMASEIVPQTIYCEPADWNARVCWTERRGAKVEEDMEKARDALGRMIQASGI
jgi:hypothetical protein